MQKRLSPAVKKGVVEGMSGTCGGFELLPHTADIMVRAKGRSIEEAFSNAAVGMYEVMTSVASIEPLEDREVVAEGFDLENLLYNFLENLLVLLDTEGFLVSRVKSLRISKTEEGYRLTAVVSGERFSPDKHESRVLVKAITYHEMRIYREDNCHVVEYVPDI